MYESIRYNDFQVYINVIINIYDYIYEYIMKYFDLQVAKALMERETLSYEDIEKLIGPPPHGNKMPDDYVNLTHVEAAAGGSTE